VLPSAFNPYNFPKLLVMALAIAAGVFAVRRGRLSRSVWIIVAVGAVLFVVASLATHDPLVALVGRWPRYEGLPTLAVYAGSAWLGARLLSNPRPDDVKVLYIWAAMATIVLAVFSALDAIDLSPIGATSLARTGSLLGNATDQGLIAMIYGAILLAPAIRQRSPLLVLGVVGSLVTVSLSGSRAAIVATGVVFLIHAAQMGRAHSRWLILPVAGLAALVAALPQARDRLFGSVTLEGRFLAWGETMELARDHLIWGVGPSGYSDAIGRYQDAAWVDALGSAEKPDSPHSWPLQALATGGLPLMIAALTLAGVIVFLGWRAVTRSQTGDQSKHAESPDVQADLALGLFSGVVAYGLALLISFTTPGTTCLAAFLTGALISVSVGRQEEHRWARPVMTVATAVAVVSLVFACLTDVTLRSGADLAAAGRVKEAGKLFARVEQFRPLDSDAHMLASQSLAQQASRGDLRAARMAEEQARASLRATPDSYESAVALGVALITQQRHREAIRVLDAAVADYPYRAPAYTQRAIARLRTGKIRPGLRDLGRAIELRPDDPTPRRILQELRERADAGRKPDK
jgi:hypothetical protein